MGNEETLVLGMLKVFPQFYVNGLRHRIIIIRTTLMMIIKIIVNN